MKIKQDEKEIENQCLFYLKLNNIFCWKNQTTGIFDPKKKMFRKSHNPYHLKGVSDIVGMINGRFLAIEVKSKTGRLSSEQVEFIKTVNDNGGTAFMVRSVDELESKLKELGYPLICHS